jgi:alkanesulfonate monooxygenase SsuD/methylene tetrahydromethanopterin reductase-like flavin-dependent oxidoreductase (luciferase family)
LNGKQNEVAVNSTEEETYAEEYTGTSNPIIPPTPSRTRRTPLWTSETVAEQTNFAARQAGGIATVLQKVGAELESGDQREVGRYAKQIGESRQVAAFDIFCDRLDVSVEEERVLRSIILRESGSASGRTSYPKVRALTIAP